MSDTLIKVEGVSKKFCRSLKKSLWYGMQDLGGELLGRQHGGNGALREGEFWAVSDVGFELKRGECLGLIGHNGAGKTTLLRMLNGLIKPDIGRIEVRGRVGALISLGAGFNPVLSGRENIYVNASVLGLSTRELDLKMEEIIEFSELTEFIDMPVQSYSSGMTVRLGFSIATALKPDILLLDEVLAVGDIGFQIKCGNRIREIAHDCAVIFVSHNMQYVSAFCSRAMLLGRGRVLVDGSGPAPAIQAYFGVAATPERVTGSGQVCVASLSLTLADGSALGNPSVIDQGSHVVVKLKLAVAADMGGVKLSLAMMDASQNGIASLPLVEEDGRQAWFGPGEQDLSISLGAIELNAGNYSIMVVAQDYGTERTLLRHEGAAVFQVHSPNMNSVAKIIRPVRVRRLPLIG